MKRFISLVLALFACVGVASAQAYPPELAGLIALTSEEDIAFVTTLHYNLPWSMPAPDQVTGPLVNIEVWTALPDDPGNPHASQLIATMECMIYDQFTAECHWPGPQTSKSFSWDPLSQSYLAKTMVYPDGSESIEAYVWKGDHWRHYIGHVYFEAHPPQYYWWTWYAEDIQPHVLRQRRAEQPTPEIALD